MTGTVLKTEERVLIYDKETGSCIAQHKRYLEITGEKTHILPEHLTPKEKRQRLTKEQWVEDLSNAAMTERRLATYSPRNGKSTLLMHDASAFA